MFSLFKRAKPPAISPANPGQGHNLRVVFNNDDGAQREEHVDLLAALVSVLESQGHKPIRRDSWLELANGVTLYPQVWTVDKQQPAGVRVASTIQIAHPSLTSDGVFEYQHARGDDLRDAFARGFEGWAKLDLPVYLDALCDKPQNSMVVSKSFQYEHGGALHRRVLLGPTAQYASTPAQEPQGTAHAFCACCLFSRSLAAFEPLLAADRFFGLRMYAARDEHGGIEADCRVNGEDYPRGAEALRRYVESWPMRGFEYRKQYAVLQTRPEPANP